MRWLGAVIPVMLAAGCAGRAAPANVPPRPPVLPGTPAGTALGAWLEAYNQGDSVRIAASLARLYTAEALARRSAAERAGGVMGWRREYGGFEPVRIDSVQRGMVVITVRQSLTRGWGMLFVEVDSASPAKVTGVSLIPFVEPPDWRRVERAGSEEALAERVSALADQLAGTGSFRGVVLMTRGDQVILHRGYGIAADSSFELASVSKMFTAVAILQLVEQGMLSTDATIGSVLPEYPPGPSATQVTIQHLLTMSAGIPDLFRSPRYRGRQDQFRTLRDHWPLFVESPLEFPPGSGWSYSNSNFMILGSVIEQLSGESFADFIRKYVLDRAGMSRTTAGSPAGGGRSTAQDLAAFGQAFLGGRLVGPEMVTRATTGYIATEYGGRDGFGLETRDWNGVRIVGHGGAYPGVSNQVDFFPAQGYSVVVLSNVSRSGAQALANYARMLIAGRHGAPPG
ncbi:MAG TPA: serine hydrolase domain-containing protein [Gemmatimonadales bacterium]|nr:serine hydrolase domain-containing protein [Gemmatimonadales bacterium]